MAKNNYPEELINLVEEYLTDGIITAKERQVLLNKAQKMGIDVDEFDLYIDAQQQKVDQQVDSAASKKRGKTCPFCGTPVPQLADKCPQCGQFITPEASEELQEIFDNLEEALVDFKAGKDIEKNKANVERYSRKARMYYSNNPKIQVLLKEIEKEMVHTEQVAKSRKRKALFSNYWFWYGIAVVVSLIAAGIIYLFNKRAEIFHQIPLTIILCGLLGGIFMHEEKKEKEEKELERRERMAKLKE